MVKIWENWMNISRDMVECKNVAIHFFLSWSISFIFFLVLALVWKRANRHSNKRNCMVTFFNNFSTKHAVILNINMFSYCRYALTKSPSAVCPQYRTLGCIFNNKSFYANIQVGIMVLSSTDSGQILKNTLHAFCHWGYYWSTKTAS